MKWQVLGMGLALAASACVIENELHPLDVPEGCNPLASEHDCLLPYPSDFFIEDGLVSPSANALRLFDSGEVLDPFPVHRPTAFSVGSQILTLFPQGVDDAPLVGPLDDFSLSLTGASPTVLLDVETGERVLHLAELDPRATDVARRALVIRPLERLRNDARYVVAIHGLSDESGNAIEPPEGFRRLRDGRTAFDPELAGLGARYEDDIFAPLEQAGITRTDLQLAWDFTTQPIEETTGDLLAVRQQILDYYAANSPEIAVVEVLDSPEGEASTFRRLELTVTVPLFLDTPDPMAPLHRDEQGHVTPNGTVAVPFSVMVPNSVANRASGAPPARLMQFGHGFFGSREESHGYPAELADERELVVVAADWWGMSDEDRAVLADVIVGDTSNTMRFTDRLHQGLANFMALAIVAKGPLVNLPELQIGDGPVFDPSTLSYYGISMGGILGGTYMGITPHIDKGVLSVGGANFSFMMFRAQPFIAFLAVLQLVTADPVDQQKFTALTQTSFDRIEPLTYDPWVLQSPLEDGPAERQLLMQIGVGDAAVPNFASHIHARAIGLSLLAPENRVIAGIEVAGGPLPSALVEFDFGLAEPLPGTLAIPSTADSEAHEGVRRLDAAKEQIHRFLLPDGVVEATCQGACDPE